MGRAKLASGYGGVAQWQEAIVLGTIQCQFESDLEYQYIIKEMYLMKFYSEMWYKFKYNNIKEF